MRVGHFCISLPDCVSVSHIVLPEQDAFGDSYPIKHSVFDKRVFRLYRAWSANLGGLIQLLALLRGLCIISLRRFGVATSRERRDQWPTSPLLAPLGAFFFGDPKLCGSFSKGGVEYEIHHRNKTGYDPDF